MNIDLTSADSRAFLTNFYRSTLLDDVIPFWLKHGMDSEFGGILSCLDRDGTLVDSDKSIWIQGRTAWTFSTIYNTVEKRPEWLEAARSCIEFLRNHALAPDGKMYFSVTREGKPLRMRRYVYSESFAVIANAAYAYATGDEQAAEDAVSIFETYLHYSFEPGVMPPKFEPTRPTQGIGPHMIGINTAQELRKYLGDVKVLGRTCTEWIDYSLAAIEKDFFKPELEVLMETVGPNGEIIDSADGRLLNPGHATECAWFVMREGHFRNDQHLIKLGTQIFDWMMKRGWDEKYGGLFYFRDLKRRPVQEYWHDMKFWWPHNEAEIAALYAWQLTGEAKYAEWHALIHRWSVEHFSDPEFGEWFGYVHRDGRRSNSLKGTMWKGPFHLPRMLLLCAQALENATEEVKV